MSYFHETIWKGVPKFLRRVDTALKNIGINERVPHNAPVIQFSSWMGGDRDGTILTFDKKWLGCISRNGRLAHAHDHVISIQYYAGNPRVTPEVTRDVCLLARMMAANLYYSQIEDLMFEVLVSQPYGLHQSSMMFGHNLSPLIILLTFLFL